MSRSRLLALVVAAGLVASVVACKPKKNETTNDDDSGLAEDGSDTNAAESDTQLLTSSLLTQTGSGTIGLASAEMDFGSGDLGTRGIGDGAKLTFFPRGCVNPQPNEAEKTIIYSFKDCTGPYALLNISGELKVTYVQDGNKLHLDLVATDLLVNKATVDWTAQADIVANGLSRTMTWKAQLSGTTARGREFSRTNEVKVAWTVGEPCFALEGTSTGNVRGRNIKTDVDNFRRCKGSCPDAGGVITVTNLANNAKVKIEFDGSNRAKITGPKGGTASLPLLCRAN